MGKVLSWRISFGDLPIQRKLMLVIMVTSMSVLLLSSLALILHDAVTFWKAEKGKLTTLADIIANNTSAALMFDDPKAAEETLRGLETNRHVLSAFILKEDGKVFASYLSKDHPSRGSIFPGDPVRESLHDTLWKWIEVKRPISLDTQKIGRVVIQSDLGELHARFGWLLAVVALVTAGSVLLAYLLSTRLQRFISEPILRLAQTMKRISENRDYGLRVEKQNRDEIGVLHDGFNEMLSQIQERDEALIHVWDELKEQAKALERELNQRRHAEAELVEKTEELARSNRELEQFAYVASHDLQEPLRMVTSYVQLLSKRYHGNLDSDADEFIGFAVDGATRMQRLINDLLTYSRVGTRGKALAPTDCEILLQETLQNLKVSLEEKKATITHDSLPTVMADPIQVGQLFQNLVGNAIKFQGEVPPRVHISASRNGKGWIFSVRDNGIGIAPEYQERIFLIFQRLHHRDQYPGTGIGLAVCKKIVERHGGRIWVESRPGEGATFSFTLPAKGEREQ